VRWPPSARRRRIAELRAQARQIIQDRKVPRTGESEYRFTADGAIRTLLVDEDLRRKLSSGALVIVRMDDRYELLPRVAADKVRERDAAMIVLDHGHGQSAEAPEPRARRRKSPRTMRTTRSSRCPTTWCGCPQRVAGTAALLCLQAEVHAIHHFYDQMCPDAARTFNFAKRTRPPTCAGASRCSPAGG
jgi:hypothetical protein